MPANAQIQPDDEALNRLMKSVPAEFAATFIALNSFMEAAPEAVKSSVLVGAGIFMLLILPFYQWKVRGIIALSQQVAAWLAFLILGINISGSTILGNTNWYSPYYGGAAVILWAIVAPIFTVQKS